MEVEVKPYPYNPTAFPCVGYAEGIGPDGGAPFPKLWLNAWFLKVGIFVAPGYVHVVDKDNPRLIRRIRRDDRSSQIYVLTDEFDSLGRRLAVWPD